ncbi:MAG TPA: glycosyltransferase family 39 protein [Pyrinomonadaceae bacterium]|nr:glycosyltransferase family 39 protein [Pyrinomonadaceae bacterium]HMP66266.1 glycosyltransferase family 39 protein [Pyrinomonadaceae bacterium]
MTTGQKGVIAGLVSLYIVLRLWGLTDACLWFDEIFGVHAAEHDWGGMIRFAAQDLIHPPLFYALLKLWISVGGDSLMWLRLFPVVFAVLAIFPFLQICRELRLGWKSMALALLLFSANGALIKYAQEVRMYSLLLFLSLMSIWLFSRFFIKGKGFVALVFVNILLVYTHYFGWLVVISEVTAILVFQRIKLRKTLLMFGITAAAFVPWAIMVFRAATAGSSLEQNIGWIERPGITAIFDLLFDLVEPFYFQASSADPISLLYISIPMLIAIGTAKLFYLAEWKVPEKKEAFMLLSVLAGLPIAVSLLASWLLPYSVWGSRHLIIIFAPMLLMSAVFITEINRKTAAYGILGFVIVLTTAAFIVRAGAERTDPTWCTWEQAARNVALSAEMPAGDEPPAAVYAFEDLSAYHLWFALRKYPNYRVYKIEGISGIEEDRAFFLPRGFDEVERIKIKDVPRRRAYAAFRDSEFLPGRPPLLSFTERGFELRKQQTFAADGPDTFLVEIY